MAGRRPKPLALHQLNGNPRHFSQADLTGANNPQPEVGIPEMPKGMPKAARREWRRVIAQIQKEMPGVLTVVDGPAIADMCRATADVEACDKLIAQQGLTFVTHFEDKDGNLIIGDIKANPAVAIRNAAMKIKKSIQVEFGMTAAARAKLKVEKNPESDKMGDFLAKKKSEPLVVTPEAGVGRPN